MIEDEDLDVAKMKGVAGGLFMRGTTHLSPQLSLICDLLTCRF